MNPELMAPSLLRRMACWIYEGLLLFGVLFISGYLFSTLSQKRAFVRYVLSWIWFIPPLAILAPYSLSGGEVAVLFVGWVLVWALLSRFHPQRQFWHDAWAGTRLINTQPVEKADGSAPPS